MKPRLILFILIAMTAALLASPIIPYNNAKPPALQLPAAYNLAMATLGSQTNYLHCISVSIATTFSSDGEWFFTFYSTNSRPKWVTVEFNGKTHIENIMIR
jgi:hypothetical protein